MKRYATWTLYLGFGLVLAGFLTFIPVFAGFPVTRDFPWATLLMFAAGLALLGVGVARAYRQRDRYRGRVVGPILALLSVLTVSLFVWGIFVNARDLPASAAAPHVGQKAPDFTLPDQDCKPVALADLLSSPASTQSAATQTVNPANAAGVVLIFYRGHW